MAPGPSRSTQSQHSQVPPAAQDSREPGRIQRIHLTYSTQKIPPTGVGGLFRSCLQKSAPKPWNPPNGSWGIVQIQPCIVLSPLPCSPSMHVTPFKAPASLSLDHLGAKAGSEQSPNCRWG